jgi:aspartate racemase
VLHIVDAVLAEMPAGSNRLPVGLLATDGTLQARVYEQRAPQVRWIMPTGPEMERLVMPGIRAVKALRQAEGQTLLRAAAQALVARGAAVVVMGCTEIPVALEPLAHSQAAIGVPLVDSNAALALACVRWAQTAATPAAVQG